MSDCDFEFEILPSITFNFLGKKRTIFAYQNLRKAIALAAPNVIITNGFSLATTKLWIYDHFKKYSYIIWSGAIQNPNRGNHSLMRSVHRKLLVKRAKAFITYGTMAKNYLVTLGAPPGKITLSLNTVDTKFFVQETEKLRSTNKIDWKNSKIILYIGHLTKGKRLDLLLKATKELKKLRQDFFVEIVGSGPELENLKNLAEKIQISNLIRFEGYHQKTEIPKYLARANCFVFPSGYDVWGLVLVEAMAAGLPCISSRLSGATLDLIKEGKTGFSMDFEETVKIAEKIHWIFENPQKAAAIGENAKYFISEQINLEKAASGFVKAVTEL